MGQLGWANRVRLPCGANACSKCATITTTRQVRNSIAHCLRRFTKQTGVEAEAEEVCLALLQGTPGTDDCTEARLDVHPRGPGAALYEEWVDVTVTTRGSRGPGSVQQIQTALQSYRLRNACTRGMAWASAASNATHLALNLGAGWVRLPTESLCAWRASMQSTRVERRGAAR